MDSYGVGWRGRVSRGMVPLLALHVANEYSRLGRIPPVTSGLILANSLIFLRPGPLHRLLPSINRVWFNPNLIVKVSFYASLFSSFHICFLINYYCQFVIVTNQSINLASCQLVVSNSSIFNLALLVACYQTNPSLFSIGLTSIAALLLLFNQSTHLSIANFYIFTCYMLFVLSSFHFYILPDPFETF